MKKMKYHDNPPVNPQPEIVIKEVIKEVEKEVFVYQPAQIITREVIPAHLTEEINMLKQKLVEKDQLIAQISFEKKALLTEVNDLKEDKADLKSDKLKLYEEIDFLRKTTLISKEKLLHKASELEQWGKMSEIEQSREMYNFIQENSKTTSVVENNNVLDKLFLNGTGESIYPVNENEVLHSQGVPLSQDSSLSGEVQDSFSLIN